MRKSIPRNFRPWPSVQEQLDSADSAGFNVSELINLTLNSHLNATMRKQFDAAAKVVLNETHPMPKQISPAGFKRIMERAIKKVKGVAR